MQSVYMQADILENQDHNFILEIEITLMHVIYCESCLFTNWNTVSI